MKIKTLYYKVFSSISLILALLLCNDVKAQLQVTQGGSLSMTPEQLVQSVLVGQGVTIDSVYFNGSMGTINCNAIGKFTTGATATNIGIDSGIVMGSGAVSFAIGPNNNGGGSAVSGCNSYYSSALANAASGTTNDCAVLEFDFYPSSDTIKFNYVFASEEYDEYVCGTVNDIFGFFISGPNPNGGNYVDSNIAIIPGTTLPVSINTVNNGSVGSNGSMSNQPCVLTNSAYYRHNNGNSIQYDGFTTILTAWAEVIPCRKYHLVLAIADVGDHAFDSGVFLQANSLSSNGISFEFENPSNPEHPEDLYEGCMAIIHMTRADTMPTPTNMAVTFTGTATNGDDFDWKNTTFAFPANTTTHNYTILPLMDNEVEGTNGVETMLVTFQVYESCPPDSVSFNIIDIVGLNAQISRDTLTSSTYSTWLHADITGGMPNRSIVWKNLLAPEAPERYGDSIYVPTTTDSRWVLYVHDSCGSSQTDTMLVGIRRGFAFPYRDTMICANEPLDLYVRFSNATDTLQDSCVWFRNNETIPFELQNDTVRVYPDTTTKYYIHSYVTWNGQIWEDVDSILVLVVPLPEVHVIPSTTRICDGESTLLTGIGAANYSWDGGENFVSETSHTFVPDTTGYILVLGKTNGADCYGKDSVLITVDTIPDVVIDDGGGVCGGEEAELSVVTSAESLTWTAAPPDPSLGGQETRSHIIVNPSSTTMYTVTAVNGVCTNSKSTTVSVEPMPIAIGEVTPRTVSLGEMEAVFSDISQYSSTRKWEFPDGVVRTEKEVAYIVPDDVDSISVRLWAYNPYDCFDTTMVTVYVDHTTLWIPNAFTPEESTNNTFLVKMNDVQRYHIFIYDRRGALVYESFDPEKPWDGKAQNGEKCPQGVYTYLVSCHKITYPFEQIIRKGTVVLLR